MPEYRYYVIKLDAETGEQVDTITEVVDVTDPFDDTSHWESKDA